VIGPVSKIRGRGVVHAVGDHQISRDGAIERFIPMHEHIDTTWSTYESPLGRLTLVAGPRGLRTIAFPGETEEPAAAAAHGHPGGGSVVGATVLAEAAGQLDEYFAGERRSFELPLDIDDQGSPFQRSVWSELTKTPFGATTSYGAVARAIGRLDRIRAVGGAVGSVPVPIVVPCHRVIGSSGDLVGYGGGLPRKRALLELEARVSGNEPLPALWSARQLAML
jgi:methylated-DNA-[protein]-cysteine S-methyltransferase